MVGMHWFMWTDYAEDAAAQGGYPYPPDRNVGLVSHGESPIYEELTRWVARANREVEAIHRGALWTQPAKPASSPLRLKRFTPVLDGDLAEWPKDLTFRPSVVHALVDNVPPDHRYALAWDEQGLYLAGEITDASFEPTHADRPWHGDQLSLHLSPLKPGDDSPAEATLILIYPIGAGPDERQPHAVQWDGSRHHRVLPLQAVRRPRPGGYTIEACIPATALQGFSDLPERSWQLQLWYRNVGEIQQSGWEGIITLEP
jgi:hypothetical protein